MDLVPPHVRSSVVVYRVKPPSVYNTLGLVEYKRKRYVVIHSEGHEICSCLHGRHTGIPCRHFFAVVKYAKRPHGFNIAQVHEHWINPLLIGETRVRPWVYLQRDANGHAVTRNTETLVQRVPLVHLDETHNTDFDPLQTGVLQEPESMIEFEGSYLTPRQVKSAITKRHAASGFKNEVDAFMKTNNSPARQQTLTQQIAVANEQTREELRLLNGVTWQEVPVDHGGQPVILDPLKHLQYGRKQEARIKSGLEKSASKMKQSRKKTQNNIDK